MKKKASALPLCYVIKIGSSVLTRNDGTLDVTRMSAIVDQVVELKKSGINIILVSSGAVAAGRADLKTNNKLDIVSSRQLFSSIGQVKLINLYYSLFRQHNTVCGQVLATKDDFSTRRHYLNQRNCIQVMLDNNVVPIMNENDAISVNELMFTDNDELSGMVATMMNCRKLIILSNIDGIYNGNPQSADSTVIKEIDLKNNDIEDYIQTSKSSVGRGGMQSKYNIARKVAEEGIEVIIANGKKENILLDILNPSPKTVFTRFVALPKRTSSIKKWIAHSDSFAKGEVYINKGAKEALLSNKAVSILPIGITKIAGEFEPDDIVKIMDESGEYLGVGKSAYSSTEGIQIIGKKQNKPFIHYDYLFIEK